MTDAVRLLVVEDDPQMRERFERAFAASAGVDLGFHHRRPLRELFEGNWKFFQRGPNIALGHGNPVFMKKFFGLVFVYVHFNVL